MPHAMTIRYQNTFRDIMAFCFYHSLRLPFFIGVSVVGFALLSLMVFHTVFQVRPENYDAVTKVIVFAIVEIMVLSCLAALFALSVVLTNVSSKNKTVFTERTIMLGEDSFTEETPYKKTEQKWAIVQKLARTKSYIFIYVAQHEVHIVPRRAFRDDAEWDAIYEYCRQRTRAA